MTVIGIIIAILLISGMIAFDIIYLITWTIKLFKCRKIEECKNRKCLVKDNCYRYNSDFTPEEYERIQKLIDELDA